jgi:DNA-binding transcriptional MerR regulator
LLKPARGDPLTGYRQYTPDKVVRRHRVLVLRDLGVPLSEVGQLIDNDVTVEQLRGILRLRQAEARARLAAQTEQLTRVQLWLAQLEEGPMADYKVIVKRLEPMHVVALSENLAGVEEIGEACGRMYPRLHAAMAQHQVRFDGLSLARYEDTADEDLPLRLTTALRIPGGAAIENDGLTTIDLPAVERAATTVVRGAPAGPRRVPRGALVDRPGRRPGDVIRERELHRLRRPPRYAGDRTSKAMLEPDRSWAQGADHGPAQSHA